MQQTNNTLMQVAFQWGYCQAKVDLNDMLALRRVDPKAKLKLSEPKACMADPQVVAAFTDGFDAYCETVQMRPEYEEEEGNEGTSQTSE